MTTNLPLIIPVNRRERVRKVEAMLNIGGIIRVLDWNIIRVLDYPAHVSRDIDLDIFTFGPFSC